MVCVLQTTKFLAAAVNDQAEPRRIVVAWITPVVVEQAGQVKAAYHKGVAEAVAEAKKIVM